jgi:hypothetical protein
MELNPTVGNCKTPTVIPYTEGDGRKCQISISYILIQHLSTEMPSCGKGTMCGFVAENLSAVLHAGAAIAVAPTHEDD